MGAPTKLSEQAYRLLDEAAEANIAAEQQIEDAEWSRKRAIVRALDAGVPMLSLSKRLGVTRPAIYRWRAQVDALNETYEGIL